MTSMTPKSGLVTKDVYSVRVRQDECVSLSSEAGCTTCHVQGFV